MTNELRERAMQAIENGEFTIEKCKEIIAQQERVLTYWTAKSYAWEAKYKIASAQKDIEYFNAVMEILIELAEIEIANEAVQGVMASFMKSSKVTLIRQVVAVMANKLKKIGYTLSAAFKRAWGFVKCLVNPLEKADTF